jgi:hypothetical protein
MQNKHIAAALNPSSWEGEIGFDRYSVQEVTSMMREAEAT